MTKINMYETCIPIILRAEYIPHNIISFLLL